MSGLPDFNYPLFNQVAATLRGWGYIVENPADNGAQLPVNSLWVDYLKAGLRKLIDCDLIVLLPNWQKSKGVSIERQIAKELSIPMIELTTIIHNATR